MLNITKLVSYSFIDSVKAVTTNKESAHNMLKCELGSFKARILFPLLMLFPNLQQNKVAAKIRNGLWADVTPWFNECFARSLKRLNEMNK